MSAPLCFFPETSHAFAHTVLLKNKDEEEGFKAAAKKWESGYLYPGEGENLYLKKCYGGHLPENDEFKARARKVFNPLFKAIKEG